MGIKARVGKMTFPIEMAKRAAVELVRELKESCLALSMAGSVRRNVGWVHDIDLVAWPVYAEDTTPNLFGEDTQPGGPDDLVEGIRRMATLDKVSPEAKIIRFEFRGMPVEVYLAERDGSNFQALMQMRTGSQQHNICLAQKATEIGLTYKAGYGIFKRVSDPDRLEQLERVDDGTERGIYAALGMAYPAPENRR